MTDTSITSHTPVGWQLCCVSRGTLVDGSMSYTGCAMTLSNVDFFMDTTTDRTYQHCYSAPEAFTYTPLVYNRIAVNAPIPTGYHSVPNPTTWGTDRKFGIITNGQAEGAHKFVLNPYTAPKDVYCTGQGVVTAEMECTMNSCGDTTNTFIIITTLTPSEGQTCYFNCYTLL